MSVSEAERLRDIADSLRGVLAWPSSWESWGLDDDGEFEIRTQDGGWSYRTPAEFRATLLGLMADYVGTEAGVLVLRLMDGSFRWCSDDENGHSPDILTAYRDCCMAIARKRGGK